MDRGDDWLALPACLAPLPYLHARQGGCAYGCPETRGLSHRDLGAVHKRGQLSRLSLSQLPTPEPQITQARARPLLPWKCLAVFLRRACTVTSESAHSRTSLRPYKWVLWQSALKAFWRGQERAVCELWVPRSPSSPGTLGVWQGTLGCCWHNYLISKLCCKGKNYKQ